MDKKNRSFYLAAGLALAAMCAAFAAGCGGGAAGGRTLIYTYNWVEAGTNAATAAGISGNSGSSLNPSIKVDPSGNSIVAWSDNTSGNYEIYVKKWSGTAWVEMGAGSASGGGISANAGSSASPTLLLDASNRPIVAWDDDTSGNREIYVKRWDGTAWVEMGAGAASGGGISANAGASTKPALGLDFNGRPIIAWQDNTNGNFEIYVRHWDGSDWVEMGAGSATGGGISANAGSSLSPCAAVFGNGDFIVAWADNTSGRSEIYARRWVNNAWTDVGNQSSFAGGISRNAGNASSPAASVDAGGNAMVAWSDDASGNAEIYIRKWDGTQWAEMETNSATGVGISRNAGTSDRPTISVDGSGNTNIAWQDNTTGNYEIYAYRWNGLGWVLLDTGESAPSAGGVSRTAGSSLSPSLTANNNGDTYIAWSDSTSGNPEIYVRKLLRSLSSM